MERQEHCTQFQNQTDAILGHLNFPVRLWNMDPHSRIREKDTNYRNEMLPKTLGISYRDHVTNEKVGNRIRQAIGPYEDLLTTVKKRKLRWYGHKTRSTGLAKMILQGTVQGGRRRGRQKKRWEDNITEWTGLKLGEALRKAENREEWRTVVARSSLVPQRSNRLWDKWSEVKQHHLFAPPHPPQLSPVGPRLLIWQSLICS